MKNYITILLLWLAVSIFGSVMVYSASYSFLVTKTINPYAYLINNLIIIILLLMLLFIAFKIKKIDYIKLVKRSSFIFIIVIMVSLLGLLILPNLRTTGGAESTYIIFGQSFQPMEWFKIAVIIYLADKLSRSFNENFKIFSMYFLIPALGLVLIFLQPDLGGTIVIAGVIICMIIINGQHLKSFSKIALVFIVVVLVIGSMFIKGYQLSRLQVWVNPFDSQLDEGYQPIQGYIAIADGGFFGKGLLNSSQKNGAVAEPFSDFIYVVILEELGFMGTVIVIGSLGSLSLLIIKVGIDSKNRFVMLYSTGVAMLILIQTFVNIGGVTGTIPMTGLTLPFISYGSNSYVSLSLGVILVILFDRQLYQKKHKKLKMPIPRIAKKVE